MYSKKQIKDGLKKLGAPKNSLIMVHASLRIVGDVEGGGKGLLDALIEYFTEDGGLLCIPTHTWANLGKDKITLDFLSSESNLGALPTLAAQDSRGIRSENPTHSVVVFGDKDKALKLIRDDAKVLTPTAPDSCYGKLYEQNGWVLLLGVAQDKNTYLHTVDEILNRPNRMSDKPIKTTVRKITGEIIERELCFFDTDYTSDISHRFPKYDTAFRYHGCITQGFVGDAPTQLCNARGMLEVVKLLIERSGGKDPLALDGPIPPKWYSKS